jgi:hypothetical protein
MKKLLLGLITLLLSVSLYGETVDQSGVKDGYDVRLYTQNTPIVGNNEFFVTLQKDGKDVEGAKVKIKVFMPEMPGMPYMEYEDKATKVDDVYKMMINFSMGGTWQYHLKFKTGDDVIHTVRGSVNL